MTAEVWLAVLISTVTGFTAGMLTVRWLLSESPSFRDSMKRKIDEIESGGGA